MPDGLRGTCPGRASLQAEDGRDVRVGKRLAGVPQPHLVGHEHERSSGKRPFTEPIETFREPRPVRREPLPDDAKGPAVGKLDGGVQGRGPVPAQPDGSRLGGDGRGQPVDDAHGVEPLHEDAPPLGGDWVCAKYPVQSHVFQSGQVLESCCGEAVASGGAQQVSAVGDRGCQALPFQGVDGVVGRAVGNARHGGQLQTVEKGHGGQPPHQQQVPFSEVHEGSP